MKKKRRYRKLVKVAPKTWVRSPKTWFRSRKFNRHHIVNKCRGGTWDAPNILKMDTERHNAWHFLFGNMSFRDVIALLLRTLEFQKNKTE